MRKEDHVIYIPGLHDQHPLNNRLIHLVPHLWNPLGVTTHIFAPHWEQETSFAPLLANITDTIDNLVAHGHRVSLVGQSAGGGAAANAFFLRRHTVHRYVNITGRLKKGDTHDRPSLEWAAKGSPAFKESVLLFERDHEPYLQEKDRSRMMTIRPFFDEVVPKKTVPITDATNLVAPFPEHTLGGVLITALYRRRIITFITN